MHEIKFRYRVKEISAGRTIVYEKTLEEVEAGLVVLNHVDLQVLSRDHYTGLRDKNGVEIYEGDIIRLDSWEPSVYKIDFDRGAFYIAKADGEEVGDIKYAERAEVIGNTYENPELLK